MPPWGSVQAPGGLAARAGQTSDPAHTAKSSVTDPPDEPLAAPIKIAMAPEHLAEEGDGDHTLHPEGLFVPPPQIDEYRILRALGRGGMGQVFLGHDSLLDRPVAVKFLVTASPTNHARMRFLQEARAIARLQHPNVVAVYRVGIFSGLPYLVSELVAGPCLDHLSPPLPWRRVLDIGLDLARGLSAVHRHGILHRDIKPANSASNSCCRCA